MLSGYYLIKMQLQLIFYGQDNYYNCIFNILFLLGAWKQ